MRSPATRSLLTIIALAVVAIILWIDIATGWWQEYVILAGLAAGVVTFLLTALVIDRVVERSAHKRWEPVTRLALTDILHAIADEERSEIAHGIVYPSLIDQVPDLGADDREARLTEVGRTVVAERIRLTEALGTWSAFLAASADAGDILDNSAELAERLDRIRDATVELRDHGGAAHRGSTTHTADLNSEIAAYNRSAAELIEELERVIVTSEKLPPR